MTEDFNKDLYKIDEQELLDDEVELEEDDIPNCAICGDSGVIEHGYWEDEHDEFVVTKYTTCECSRD